LLFFLAAVAVICVKSVGVVRISPQSLNPLRGLDSIPTLEAKLEATQQALFEEVQKKAEELSSGSVESIPLPTVPSVEEIYKQIMDKKYPYKIYLPNVGR